MLHRPVMYTVAMVFIVSIKGGLVDPGGDCMIAACSSSNILACSSVISLPPAYARLPTPACFQYSRRLCSHDFLGYVLGTRS